MGCPATIYARGQDGSVFRGRVLPFQNFDRAYREVDEALEKASNRIPKNTEFQKIADRNDDHISYMALAEMGVIEYDFRLGSTHSWLAPINQQLADFAERVAASL